MADTLSPALQKFDLRLAAVDGTETFLNQDKKTTHAEQRAVLTPWSLGCASENLDADYESFIRYSFGDAWEAGKKPFSKLEYTEYLRLIERRSGVSLLWTDGACKMKKIGAEYLIIINGGGSSGKIAVIESAPAGEGGASVDNHEETSEPTDVQIIDDDDEVADVLLEKVADLDESGFDDEELTLNTQEYWLDLAEKPDAVVYKYSCGKRQITATTTDDELDQALSELSCD